MESRETQMIYSMTGYGRYEVEASNRKVTIEMSAINHRYLDLNIRLPKSLMYLEDGVRKKIKEKVARGKFEVSIYCHSTAEEDVEVSVNEPLAKAYLEGVRQLGRLCNLEDDIRLSQLVQNNELINVQKKNGNVERLTETVEQVLEVALEELLDMRLKEGTSLKEDLLQKSQGIKELIKAVEDESPRVVLQYKSKLETRLGQLLDGMATVDEARLATEVAIFADKCAIDEELTRLKSHVEQLCHILEAGGTVGRKLDFLMQEMNREANTIGSKANDYVITQYVVELKTEIEKIREQVQNIE